MLFPKKIHKFFPSHKNTQVEDDGGGGGNGLDGSEKDYDALNDETFDKAINGDWENLHESYVRLDQSGDIKDDDGDSDFGTVNKKKKKSIIYLPLNGDPERQLLYV